MRIIANRSITLCWQRYPDAKNSLAIWEERIKFINGKTHNELRKVFPDAEYIPNENFKHLTAFNIKGNHYRLLVDIFFNTGQVFIKWFGTHAEYDKVDFNKLVNGGFRLC